MTHQQLTLSKGNVMNGLAPALASDRRMRQLRFGALLVVAVSLAFPMASAGAKSAAAPRPTIVLVHGAFASPAGWDEVADALHKDGYPTAAPELAMESVAGDVATVQSTLDSIPGDKILVGHSYGGFVITNAASGRSDVRGLVYAAAYAPESGETINGLGVGYAPGTFLAHLDFTLFPRVTVDPQFFPDDFAQDLNPNLGAQIAAEQRPTSLAVFETPSGPAAWHSIPSWYAVSDRDRAIDPALERFMAQRAGSTTLELSAGGHVAALTHYSARFVKLIEQASDAT